MFRRDQGQDRDRFVKFTARARKVLSLAQEEAQRFNHNYIGTEHLLLGLVREGDGVAAKVLVSQGVQLQQVRAMVEQIIGRGSHAVIGDIGLTPRAKRTVELAVDESRRLDHHYVGTEHLLLGLLREGEGIAAGVLESLGLTLEQLRAETLHMLGQMGQVGRDDDERPAATPATWTDENAVTCQLDDRTLDTLDALVEAGIRATRAEAAVWLIAAGIAANRDLLTRIAAKVEEARRLQAETRAATQGTAHDSEATPPADERATGGEGDALRDDSANDSVGEEKRPDGGGEPNAG